MTTEALNSSLFQPFSTGEGFFYCIKICIYIDPVCGSAHCNFIPFWSERLNKREMVARQLSARGGVLYCKHCGGRVKIAGKAALYAIGEFFLPADQR